MNIENLKNKAEELLRELEHQKYFYERTFLNCPSTRELNQLKKQNHNDIDFYYRYHIEDLEAELIKYYTTCPSDKSFADYKEFFKEYSCNKSIFNLDFCGNYFCFLPEELFLDKVWMSYEESCVDKGLWKQYSLNNIKYSLTEKTEDNWKQVDVGFNTLVIDGRGYYINNAESILKIILEIIHLPEFQEEFYQNYINVLIDGINEFKSLRINECLERDPDIVSLILEQYGQKEKKPNTKTRKRQGARIKINNK